MSASRLLISDTGLREDEHGELGVFLCEECETLNAGYGPCPYCTNATECVVVRTVEGHLLTMARPLADSFRLPRHIRRVLQGGFFRLQPTAGPGTGGSAGRAFGSDAMAQ